jgi:hypothetical protein
MYGLVNKAIEDLVCSRHGEETWEEIKRRANVDIDAFIGNESYPDDVTYKLVGAASEVLNCPADQFIEAFGEHWVLFTGKEGYGALFESSGRTFKDFVLNLPSFHSRLTLLFPNFRPPSFQCTDVTDDSLRLHYRSTRPGLSPMLLGLLKGLGVMYDTEVTVTQTAGGCENGADHGEFLIKFARR